MSFRCCRLFKKNLLTFDKIVIRHRSQRRTLGKPPGIARSLEQRLTELNYKDPQIYYKVNIGFPLPKKSRKESLKLLEKFKLNKSDPKLEKLSRNNQLIVSMDVIEKEWAQTLAPKHIKAAAEYYGVYEHLFGDAYFYPVTMLDISYSYEESVHSVYRGNFLTPSIANQTPTVNFDSSDDSLWTLIMTTPDGHFKDENSEYLHWFIGNIKGNNLKSGEEIMSYLKPFPPRGVGYLRYIFILYKQKKLMDYSDLKQKISNVDLDERTFNTYNFYQKRQDDITPAGLGFFQCEWDTSVTDFYHNSLKIEEPVYEYDFPNHYRPKQKWFPIKQAFNLYMDRYRDPKQIAKEFVLKKLKNVDPFKPSQPGLKYPNAARFYGYVPSWLKTELIKERLKKGRITDF